MYTVNPTNKTSFEVFCDMKTDGGGWTVFHKRFHGFVGFYRGWEEYKNGFGDVTGEFWLGNENIHQLTEIPSQLRVEIKTSDGNNVNYAKYSNFTVTNEASNYTLFVGFYPGTAGDQLTYHNGMAFTTKNRDNDEDSGNCAVTHKGAWWYKHCYHSNLNSNYGDVNYYWNGGSLLASEMKLKPARSK